MKKLLFIVCMLLPLLLPAQRKIGLANVILKNSLFPQLDSTWRFIHADDSAMADANYNDSNWVLIHTELKNDSAAGAIYGISWFRNRIYVSDSILGKSLAINMAHFGASEIYINGKLLTTYGKISLVADSVEYSNPAMSPFIFHFSDTGYHTIAIRYANYRSKTEIKPEEYLPGFSLSITEANETLWLNTLLRMLFLGLFLFLAGGFLTLAGLHLLLWLFRYSDKSNFFLSILCLAFSIYFIMQAYWTQTSDADVATQRMNFTGVLLMIVLLTLSALLNYLFVRIGWRFWAIAAICIAAIVLIMRGTDYTEDISSAVMVIVMLEAMVLLIKAIRTKVRGAKILAIGIIPLALFTFISLFSKLFLGEVANNSGAAQTNPMILAFAAVFSILLVLSLSGVPISMSVFLAWRFATMSKDLGKQLQQVKELSEKTQQQEAEKKRILENQKAELEQEVTLRTAEIVAEKKKSDQLLLNILPEEVAKELKEKGHTTAHQYDSVSVMFTDFVNFTVAGSHMESQALVEELHNCFKAFDEIMGKHGIEKIKTIGDAYLAVCGLPVPDPQHALKMVTAAKEIIAYMSERRAQLGDKTFEIRIGIHSGEVVAGIVGVKKFAYDIWGDTVNTAARMEQNSEAGKINISQTTYELVKGKLACTYRGEIEAKNKGMLRMYFVEG